MFFAGYERDRRAYEVSVYSVVDDRIVLRYLVDKWPTMIDKWPTNKTVSNVKPSKNNNDMK